MLLAQHSKVTCDPRATSYSQYVAIAKGHKTRVDSVDEILQNLARDIAANGRKKKEEKDGESGEGVEKMVTS